MKKISFLLVMILFLEAMTAGAVYAGDGLQLAGDSYGVRYTFVMFR